MRRPGLRLLDRLRAIPGRVEARLRPLRSTLPLRAYARYTSVRGNVLAGGIAYFAFFSVFPALAIGFTVFALVLGNQESLQIQVVQYLNASFGTTVISYHEGQQGIVTIEQLVQPEVLTTTGLIGLVTLLVSGLGWVAAVRDGVQAVFVSRDPANFVVVKLWDLLLLAAAGITILSSVIGSVAVNVATDEVLDVLGITKAPVAGWTVNVLGQIVLVVVDAIIFTLLFARLDAVDVPLRDLAGGGLLCAIGFSALKLFATELLRLTSHNRFLAASGILVGLLVWMNLVARLLLLAAAWSATVASDRGHLRTPDPTAPAVPAGVPDAAGTAAGRTASATAAPPSRPAAVLLLVAFLAGALANRLAGRRQRRRTPPRRKGQ